MPNVKNLNIRSECIGLNEVAKLTFAKVESLVQHLTQSVPLPPTQSKPVDEASSTENHSRDVNSQTQTRQVGSNLINFSVHSNLPIGTSYE